MKTDFSHVSGGCKSKSKAGAEVVAAEALSLACRRQLLSLCFS